MCFLACPIDLSSLPDRTRIHAFVDNIIETHARTSQQLEASATKYKTATDSKRRRLIFYEGDLVWVHLTRDRIPAREYNKLKSKKVGPLRVAARINDNVYRITLPAGMTTSDVFNVRYLSKYSPPDVPSDSRLNPTHPGGPDAAASDLLSANMIV